MSSIAGLSTLWLSIASRTRTRTLCQASSNSDEGRSLLDERGHSHGVDQRSCLQERHRQALDRSQARRYRETKFKSLHHYNKVNDRHLERQLSDDEIVQVGVVYLLGGISSAPGEFSTSSVLKGLKEAGENEDIKSIVLRIDSGGGDVVASESIWDAVRRVREDYGKPVVASFGNAAASGGYYAASAADAILACENTVTGSIGVASLRPTITRAFFDRFNVGIQSFFTGSTSLSTLHELDAAQRAKSAKHIDEMYDDFLQKVCDGRNISRDVVESLAGGRVMTGLSAWARCNPMPRSIRFTSVQHLLKLRRSSSWAKRPNQRRITRAKKETRRRRRCRRQSSRPFAESRLSA